MRILVVEDEPSLADLVANRLKKEIYTVDICLDGEEGLYNALLGIYDLIILDIMLPYVNGLDILKEIKKNDIKSKVIMLTAKSELEDKLLGFNEVANDYVAKPFHIDELIARVNAQLRIEKGSSEKIKLTGNSYVTSLDNADSSNSNIDFNGYKLYVNGKSIN